MRAIPWWATLLLVVGGCGGGAKAVPEPTEPADPPDVAETAGGSAPASTAAGGQATSEPSAADQAGDGTAAVAPKPSRCDEQRAPEGETDRQRQRRLKREKIAECQRVATAIQKAELQDTIASVNDRAKLTRVAAQLRTAADELDQLEVCVAGLRKLRDEYSGRARAMAAALKKAAETSAMDVQKQAIAEFRELHPKQTRFVDQLNEFCNAPVE